jgi:hypothetical protein
MATKTLLTEIILIVETSSRVTRWIEELACLAIGALHRNHEVGPLALRLVPLSIHSVRVEIQVRRLRIVTEEVRHGLWHDDERLRRREVFRAFCSDFDGICSTLVWLHPAEHTRDVAVWFCGGFRVIVSWCWLDDEEEVWPRTFTVVTEDANFRDVQIAECRLVL